MGQIKESSKMCAVGVPPETWLENTALEDRTPSRERQMKHGM